MNTLQQSDIKKNMIIVGKSSSQNCQQYQNKNKILKLLSEKCISIEFDMYVVCIYIFSDNFFLFLLLFQKYIRMCGFFVWNRTFSCF